MAWFLVLILLIFGFGILLGVNRWKDHQYTKKPTGEAMDQRFKGDIDQETSEERRKYSKFRETLDKFGG